MEQKTKVNAAAGQQDLTITRDFDLPLDLLFRAFVEADLVGQWMNTKVERLDAKKYGCYRFETTDPKGNIHGFSGVFHDLITDQRIVRTFEMENTPFGVQLEFYVFEPISEDRSRLNMHVVYESLEKRAQVLQLPFAQGINWAHNRIQEIMGKLK